MLMESKDAPEQLISILITSFIDSCQECKLSLTLYVDELSVSVPPEHSPPPPTHESDGRAACLFAAPLSATSGGKRKRTANVAAGCDCHMSPQSCLTSDHAAMEYS